MSDDYKDIEMVKITRENYDEIKDGYDAGYTTASDESFDLIEDLEKRNKKLKSGICIVNIGDPIEKRKVSELTFEMITVESWYETTILNKKTAFYPIVDRYLNANTDLERDLKLVEKRIENFKNSRLGKFLAFFGVKI